ncbi:MAG: outer membrane protein assembly factor BamE [Lentisphaeria bacterium]|nr:outer membrane protein assembly factor BamE [Lentisphaeria bacterium]NQZ70822.1 outer membrane protein assembly factor BamE [Lentisphaeria bacterium]
MERWRESRRDLIISVKKGMTEEQVLEILGKPDETREDGFMGRYRWVYGVEKKGEFPRIGSILFTNNMAVLMVECPTRTNWTTVFSAWRQLPFSESPQKTEAGLYCEIDRVFIKKGGPHMIQVSLVNEGKEPFLYSHDSMGIRFSLVIEIYDEQKKLINRDSLTGYHSPVSSDKSKWPVLKVPPGSRVSEKIPIWWRHKTDGMLYPGTYYIRVGFPFEKLKDYGSNLVKWELKEALNKKTKTKSQK